MLAVVAKVTMPNRAIDGQCKFAPPIEPVATDADRPLWSVMIPTYNCAQYLRQALESVLAQDPGPERMQIEVVDNASDKDDPEEIVAKIGRGRVRFHRNEKNLGSINNFNICIERSRGELVHILHGDDVVGSGYYDEIAELASRYPEAGLYATRCFFVDERSVIFSVSETLPEFERPCSSLRSFFYSTPIQFAATTVRRSSYEVLGGFNHDVYSVSDREIWARVVAAHGGIVSSKVLASYRMHPSSETSSLKRTGQNIKDLCRLNRIFSHTYEGFSEERARKIVTQMVWEQYSRFKRVGDDVAAEKNRALWREVAPVPDRFAKALRTAARHLWPRPSS